MNFPDNLLYTKDHEWVRIDGNTGTIGITDFAQHELGDIVYVDIPNEKATLKKEEVFGTVEAVKTVSDLFIPVSGKIIEVNHALNDAPDSVNKDPYGAGWILKIELSDASEVSSLLSASAYKALIGQ